MGEAERRLQKNLKNLSSILLDARELETRILRLTTPMESESDFHSDTTVDFGKRKRMDDGQSMNKKTQLDASEIVSGLRAEAQALIIRVKDISDQNVMNEKREIASVIGRVQRALADIPHGHGSIPFNSCKQSMFYRAHSLMLDSFSTSL
jgi:hypothetical protein